MRRPRLSTKLIAAALPLVVAVVALLGLTVRSDLNDIDRAESGAELGGVWNPLITALTAIEAESAEAASTGSSGAPAPATRRATDQAVNDVRDHIDSLGAAKAAGAHITAGRSALSAARRNLDMAIVAPDAVTEIDPYEAYKLAGRELVAVGQLLPSEAGDPALGRQLLAVVKLAEAKLGANEVIAGTRQWQAERSDATPLVTARSAFTEMEATLGEFEAIAPDDWATQYRQSGFPTQLAQFRGDLDRALRAAQNAQFSPFDTAAFSELVSNGVQFQSSISQQIVEQASIDANATRGTTLKRIGISLGVVLLAALITLAITRSITRRVKAVSAGANLVATEQLPALVRALRDPRGKTVVPDIQPVDAKGNDELAELAGAFNSMQVTLVNVAHEQLEVLRRGVSDIFVTMARRNRSLIDRQLAMLDDFEAEVDDPDLLDNYYHLDHLATRMRRNSESLLVLAGAEPKRRRVRATEIDDVVRASIGEVEDYRRIDIEHLESLQVRGTVVADISHLIAELLDNATAFSPPESPVRVGGRHNGDSYLLRIVDKGIGIPTERLGEINELLREPPVVGLSVEPTLGMSVVSLLANKHGIAVSLTAGNPGLTVDITLPSSLFGPIEEPKVNRPPQIAVAPAMEQIAARNDTNNVAVHSVHESVATGIRGDVLDVPQPVLEPVAVATGPDAPSVAEGDWTKMSLNLAAFRSGQQSAAAAVPDRSVPAALPTAIVGEPLAMVAPAPAPAPTTVPPPPPPPPAVRVPGEFDTPLAPPVTTHGPSRGPVAPATARSAPSRPPADAPALPSLPTRRPGSGPDGPDRLLDIAQADELGETSAMPGPSALQSALSTFEDEVGPLPSRPPAGEPLIRVDEQVSVAASRLDPEALRQRLRAFQTEFHSGSTDTDHNFGGNPR